MKNGFRLGEKPVNFVSWYDSARFANWMNNGQGAATTETGAYDLSSSSFMRLADAMIVMPTRSEWIKAGFFDPRAPGAGGPTGNYWTYPTMSDTAPSNVIVDASFQ